MLCGDTATYGITVCGCCVVESTRAFWLSVISHMFTIGLYFCVYFPSRRPLKSNGLLVFGLFLDTSFFLMNKTQALQVISRGWGNTEEACWVVVSTFAARAPSPHCGRTRPTPTGRSSLQPSSPHENQGSDTQPGSGDALRRKLFIYFVALKTQTPSKSRVGGL